MSVVIRPGEAGLRTQAQGFAVIVDLLGIVIWLGIAVVLATRLFKWEVV